MKKFTIITLMLALVTGVTAGCGDDDDSNLDATGGTSDTGGTAATGGTSDTGGTAATGGTENKGCDMSRDARGSTETLSGELDSVTLNSETLYELEGYVHVPDGKTLTIEPCTRIEGLPAGSNGQPGTLIVSRGGKISADGTADAPILFTSVLDEGEREAGTWGGVIILGKAPNFKGDSVLIEGLEAGTENEYGGAVDDDDSGSLRYVRIEYGGSIIGTDNEINGLTLGSVGSGTTLSHIMVNTTLDDCFEFFGGTVNADHLICNNQGDDMFDVDQGYQGTLTHLFGRAVENRSSDPNGFEMDSNKSNTDAPRTHVTAEKATLCGTGEPAPMGTTRGMVLRENVTGAFDDIVVTGFDYGVDIRDGFGTEAAPSVTLANGRFFGQNNHDIGADESGDADNDSGFSEQDWFDMGTDNEVPTSTAFTAADCQEADGPNATVQNSGLGAFVDSSDWLDGMWVDWAIE